MGQELGMKGALERENPIPDWWPYWEAGEKLHVAPWELFDQPLIYIEWTNFKHEVDSAIENERRKAQERKQRREQKKGAKGR